MASRRKLDVEEASPQQEGGPKIKFEESCVYVTTAALVCGIIMILIMLGADFGAGPFGG